MYFFESNCDFMRRIAQLAAQRKKFPTGPCAPDVVAEIERRQLFLHLQAYHERLRLEQQSRFWRRMASFWPVALGLVLGLCSPYLYGLVTESANWAATLLFPLTAVTDQRDLHMSRSLAQALSQILLYAQFPIDGLLARMLLKRRVGVLEVCEQVTFFHVFIALYLGLASGYLGQMLPN